MDDLSAEVSTVYPGKRISVGGDADISDLFTNLSTVYLPYRTSKVKIIQKCQHIYNLLLSFMSISSNSDVL